MALHPILPCGYNSWENDGDEVDGAGVNQGITPPLLVATEFYPPTIVTADMLNFFIDGCPDYVPPCVDDTVVVAPVNETYVVRAA
jgi:hypothetical protein